MSKNEILFDFGFTVADEEEIFAPVVEEAVAVAKNEGVAVQERLDKLYSAVQPLLQNLKANPEKPYIHWPNRIEKVQEFEEILKNIYEGKK